MSLQLASNNISLKLTCSCPITGRYFNIKATILKSTQTVELDDFYRPATKFTADPNNIKNTYDQYFDWNRLISTVLAPIQNGFESRYMKFDWNANKFNEEEKELYPNSVIFIDGVYPPVVPLSSMGGGLSREKGTKFHAIHHF